MRKKEQVIRKETFVFIIGILIVLSVYFIFIKILTPRQILPSPGDLAYYSFESNFQDSSGNGNNGFPVSSVSYDDSGISGKALKTNGIGYLRVYDSPTLNLNKSFTIEAWIKPVDGSEFAIQYHGIVYKHNSYAVQVDGAGKFGAYVYFEDGTYSRFMNSPEIIQDNQWYYLVFTYDSTQLNFYVNGNLTDSEPAVKSIRKNESDLLIGLAGTHYFNGSLDEVGISESALSASEILSRYNSFIQPFSCIDTDGGLNYYLLGNITSSYNYTDFCSITIPDGLVEYNCNFTSNQVEAKSYICPNGCLNGACIGSPCIQNWNCSSWSTCINGNQTRTCSDLNNCNNLTGRPSLNQTCATPSCTSNWTATNNSCQSSETQTRYYLDLNNCNSTTGMTANSTISCDYDNNGIIGNFTSFSSNLNLGVFIDSEQANISKKYNSTKTIEFKEGDLTRVKFNYNFSNPIDFQAITITLGNTSNYSYIIIKGIDVEKTIYLDKKNPSSNKVCVDISDISDISQISSGCTSSGEHIISCPGNYSKIFCNDSSSQFIISGLEHSGVKEFISGTPPPLCTTNWQCEQFGSCINGNKTRICVDINNCNSLVGKPAEILSCTASCTTRWNCTEFIPAKCPESQEQTRTCTDLNNCGTTAGKPSESLACEYKKGSNWLFILFISVLAVAIIIIILLIVHFLRKHMELAKPPAPSNLKYPAYFPRRFPS